MSKTITFAKAMKEDMTAYGNEVNFNRAIVDISGLKRVQLRILYTMYKMKAFPNRPYVKCPDIVGRVIQLHPHSDAAIYDALVRLSQPWTLNYPLIDFDGQNGSEDNDAPAAPRYTSARLSPYGLALINQIESTSPYVPDYADHGTEPEFLVPAFPALFTNISKGIGVAAACNFLPHTLGSIYTVIQQRMDGVSDEEILSTLRPTFPTGGILLNGADLPLIYKTGRGSVKLRARHKIEGNRIIFTELPYQVSRTSVIEFIQEKKDARILSAFDTSDMKQKSITIECRPSANATALAEELFKMTRLEDSFNINMTIHDRKKVELRPFLSLIDEYIAQQHHRIISIAQAVCATAEEKKHELEGFIIILPNIDRVIEIIKTSDNKATASNRLIEEFQITTPQANAILALKLSQLTKRGIVDIQEEITALEQEISTQQTIIADKGIRNNKILNEISDLPPAKQASMEVLNESIPQTGAEDTPRYLVKLTTGENVRLADNDEIIVVTAERRVYLIKGKQLDKMPKDQDAILIQTPEWINEQPSLDLFGMKVHPSIITCQAKSTRGANLKL